MSEDTEGRHHRGMQHTIGLTDHIVNTKKYTTDSQSLIHHSQHSLTSANRSRSVDRHKHTISEKPIMAQGTDKTNRPVLGDERVVKDSLHETGSSELSAQSAPPSQYQWAGMQRPLEQRNSLWEHVEAAM